MLDNIFLPLDQLLILVLFQFFIYILYKEHTVEGLEPLGPILCPLVKSTILYMNLHFVI